MPTKTIIYAINGAGNLAKYLPDLAKHYKALGKSAKDATAKIGDSLGKARSGLQYMGEDGASLVADAKDWIAIFAESITQFNDILVKNKQYQASLLRTNTYLNTLKQSFADTFGPRVGRMLENIGLGALFAAGELRDSFTLAFDVLYDLLYGWASFANQVFSDMGSTIKKLFSGEGFSSNLASIYVGALAKLADGAEDTLNKRADMFRANMQKTFGAWVKAQGTQLGTVAAPLVAGATGGAKTSAGPTPLWAITLSNAAKAMAETSASLDATMSTLGDDLTAAFEAAAAAKQNTVDTVMSLGGGDLTTVLSIVAGPVGALVGSIFDLVKNLPETALALLNSVLDIYMNADEWIGKFVGEFIPHLIRVSPGIVSSFVTLLPSVFVQLIAAMPAIAQAIADVMVTTIPLWIEQLKALVTNSVNKIVDAFGSLVNPFDKIGGGNGGGEATTKRFLGIRMPSLDTEGEVLRTGLARVHKGEEIRKKGSRGATGGFNVGNVYITTPDPREVFARFRSLQGSFGIGLTTRDLVGGE